VSLVALVRDVVARVAPDMERARCAVSVTLPDEPVTGLWDRRRIEQVLLILIDNAARFGPGKPIEIKVTRQGATARLSVTDHGMGIDAARQSRIFDRFERAVSVQHYGGLGLGLFVGRFVVEGHGGTLTVESRPGEGATFTVTLPCVNSPQPPAG